MYLLPFIECAATYATFVLLACHEDMCRVLTGVLWLLCFRRQCGHSTAIHWFISPVHHISETAH